MFFFIINLPVRATPSSLFLRALSHVHFHVMVQPRPGDIALVCPANPGPSPLVAPSFATRMRQQPDTKTPSHLDPQRGEPAPQATTTGSGTLHRRPLFGVGRVGQKLPCPLLALEPKYDMGAMMMFVHPSLPKLYTTIHHKSPSACYSKLAFSPRSLTRTLPCYGTTPPWGYCVGMSCKLRTFPSGCTILCHQDETATRYENSQCI